MREVEEGLELFAGEGSALGLLDLGQCWPALDQGDGPRQFGPRGCCLVGPILD